MCPVEMTCGFWYKRDMSGRILDYRVWTPSAGIAGGTGVVRAGHSRKTAERSWAPRGRDLGMHGLLLLVEGAGTYWDSSHGERAVRAGACFAQFPGLRHDYGCPVDGRWLEAFLDIDLPLFRLLEADGVLRRDQPVVQLDRGAQVLFRRVVEELVAGRLADPRLVPLRLHELAVRIDACRKVDGERHGDALHRARQVLESDPAVSLSPQAAAHEAGMPWETFRRRFRARFGMGPAQWRLRHRLQHAGRLLLEPGATAVAVAATCGFCDAFHFSRQFQRVIGQSPRVFQRHHGVR